MKGYELKKHEDYPIISGKETIGKIPARKKLDFEDVRAMTNIDAENDVVKKGEMIRDFILKHVPALKDTGIADMEYIDIFNDYAETQLKENEEKLGE